MDSGSEGFEMALEHKNGPMVLSMRVIGRWGMLMGKESLFMQQEMFTKVIGVTTKHTDLEYIKM